MKFKLQILIFFLLSISYGQNEIKQAYFASGCFWCVESIFESLEGVTNVQSGYSGGWLKNPSYSQVLTGKTGHAESVKVSEEKKVIEQEIQKLLDKQIYPVIVTEIKKFEKFYLAESYHQDYKIKNPNNPYIWNVSVPRIEKFKSNYTDLLKKD